MARDEVVTAGPPHAIRLTPDRNTTKADGKSLTFVTADVVDRAGVVVSGADNLISFQVSGGSLAGLDNGRPESAENYQASSRAAFNGKALAMVRSGQGSSAITVTARAPGLQTGTATVVATGSRRDVAQNAGPVPPRYAPPTAAAVAADASYSGAPNTIPAAMLDGDGSTRWSAYYNKSATPQLPAVSWAHAKEWVSLSGLEGAPISSVQASFLIDSSHALPATITVSYWTGTAFVPVRNARIEWATQSGRPTRVAFTPVSTGRVRLDLTSRASGTTRGFLGITEAAAGR
ncbi:hypothetical protein SK571_42995 [Lentzea sp. BCCO 10_0798]|uniref:Glycoside hydrolase family 2 domain-containing protein n=1 Tax=Lentzea kristufekii TaxID=3095430 RepID=A0ABU4U6H4_9PSEU|nr:hypothetical protein [Lentzea sp. BCCO 10_0798]MDX8056184.1 hypothetical protein [Lentzea sp. BCCO 10_0798]